MRTLTDGERDRLRTAVLEENRRQLPEVKKTHRDHLPVRTCAADCTKYARCWHLKYGKARVGYPCIPDLKRIEKWRKAYEGGDDEIVRKDAGRIMGSMIIRAEGLLEQIDREGWVKRAPKVDIKGNAVRAYDEEGQIVYIWEEKAHPLIEPLIKVLKLLGLGLDEFELTPKSKGGGHRVKGAIDNSTHVDIKVLVAEQERMTEVFAEQLKLARQMRDADPVWKQFGPAAKGVIDGKED